MVIAIMGVLVTIAMPSFVTFTASQKVKTASFDLYAAMMFARSEAIKRKKLVRVTPQDCVDWKNGWSVREETDPPPACIPNNPAPALRKQDALTGVVFSNTTTSVVYRMDGRLMSAGALGVLIQPTTADASIKNRCIRVDLTGLPKSTNVSNTVCP